MNIPRFEALIIYFFAYSIIGYILEVLYCSIPAQRLVNRGFLHGPYLPVYGFGALLVVIVLSPFTHLPWLVFPLGVVMTSGLEYTTGFVLERVFHVRLWDYSSYRFNLRGRVCLLNSSLFGLLSLLVVYGIHPFLGKIIDDMPRQLHYPLSLGILLVLMIDASVSIFHMAAFQKRIRHIHELWLKMEERIDTISDIGPFIIEQVEKEHDKVRRQLQAQGKRILDAFPGLTIKDYEIQLTQLKESLTEWRRSKSSHKRDESRKAGKKK
jgi:uncharacterized membrane protein